jgi:hypothetical protein
VSFVIGDKDMALFHRRLAGHASGLKNSGDSCCQILCVHWYLGLGVDQQAIAAKHNNCFDARPLSDGDREIANARHR